MSSSYEKLFHQPPNISKLRVFVCLCYPWLRPYNANKLEPKSTPCVFLGYSLTQSAYKRFDSISKKIYISRHVTFVEDVFPFRLQSPDLPRPDSHTISSWLPFSFVPINAPKESSSKSSSNSSTFQLTQNVHVPKMPPSQSQHLH